MKRFIALIALLAPLAMAPASAKSTMAPATTAPASTKSTMPTCKGPIAYAVPSEKIYYVKGETMYGHAKGGTYMCEATANAKGYKKK